MFRKIVQYITSTIHIFTDEIPQMQRDVNRFENFESPLWIQIRIRKRRSFSNHKLKSKSRRDYRTSAKS